jgi:hypothetical protein
MRRLCRHKIGDVDRGVVHKLVGRHVPLIALPVGRDRSALPRKALTPPERCWRRDGYTLLVGHMVNTVLTGDTDILYTHLKSVQNIGKSTLRQTGFVTPLPRTPCGRRKGFHRRACWDPEMPRLKTVGVSDLPELLSGLSRVSRKEFFLYHPNQACSAGRVQIISAAAGSLRTFRMTQAPPKGGIVHWSVQIKQPCQTNCAQPRRRFWGRPRPNRQRPLSATSAGQSIPVACL